MKQLVLKVVVDLSLAGAHERMKIELSFELACKGCHLIRVTSDHPTSYRIYFLGKQRVQKERGLSIFLSYRILATASKGD